MGDGDGDGDMMIMKRYLLMIVGCVIYLLIYMLSRGWMGGLAQIYR